MILDDKHDGLTILASLGRIVNQYVTLFEAMLRAPACIQQFLDITLKALFHAFGVMTRQLHRKDRTMILHTVRSDGSAQGHRHVAHHSQADAHALDQGLGYSTAVEGLKNMGKVFLTDAHAVVGDTDNQGAVIDARSNRYLSELVAIVDSILDEATDNGIQVARHGIDIDTGLARCIGQLDVPLHATVTVTLKHHVHEGDRFTRAPVQLRDRAANATHLQDAIH